MKKFVLLFFILFLCRPQSLLALAPEPNLTLLYKALEKDVADKVFAFPPPYWVARHLQLMEIAKKDPCFDKELLTLRAHERIANDAFFYYKHIFYSAENPQKAQAQSFLWSVQHHVLDAMPDAFNETKKRIRNFFLNQMQEVTKNSSEKKIDLDSLWQEMEERFFLWQKSHLPLLQKNHFQEADEAKLLRSFWSPCPTLVLEQEGGAAFLNQHLQTLQECGVCVRSVYLHPFSNESQLIGIKLPLQGTEDYNFIPGEIVRAIHEAEADLHHRHLLVLKNIEALTPEVRLQLQELFRIGELRHPLLKEPLHLPENLKIMVTMRANVFIQDFSFYDRFVKIFLSVHEEYLKRKIYIPEEDECLTVKMNDEKTSLLLENGNKNTLEIPLTPRFHGMDIEQFYEKTGLILDQNTLKMLWVMQASSLNSIPAIIIKGETGIGKTFTARAYAHLTGRSFWSNPVSDTSSLSDWTGGFKITKNREVAFDGRTSFAFYAEEGSVIALSELNVLLDSLGFVSLAWWLQKIVETPPNEEGYRVITLGEYPGIYEKDKAPVIKIHKDTLFVIDTNPENYESRGHFPAVFQEMVPSLELKGSLQETLLHAPSQEAARNLLKEYLDAMRLRQDSPWKISIPNKIVNILFVMNQNGFLKKYPYVFSLRELSRIVKDIQNASGEQEVNRTLCQLMLGGLTPEDQKKMIKNPVFSSESNLSSFIAAQMKQHRCVHLKVHPKTDIKAFFSRNFSKDEYLFKFYDITPASNRGMLEGEEVLLPSGAMGYGAGVFKRLVENALAFPEKQVVYVFENIYHLVSEEASSLNEFLQTGELYIPGQEKAIQLPPHAHILFVSPTGSDISWSKAERSRLVDVDAGSLLLENTVFRFPKTSQVLKSWGEYGEALSSYLCAAAQENFPKLSLFDWQFLDATLEKDCHSFKDKTLSFLAYARKRLQEKNLHLPSFNEDLKKCLRDLSLKELTNVKEYDFRPRKTRNIPDLSFVKIGQYRPVLESPKPFGSCEILKNHFFLIDDGGLKIYEKNASGEFSLVEELIPPDSSEMRCLAVSPGKDKALYTCGKDLYLQIVNEEQLQRMKIFSHTDDFLAVSFGDSKNDHFFLCLDKKGTILTCDYNAFLDKKGNILPLQERHDHFFKKAVELIYFEDQYASTSSTITCKGDSVFISTPRGSWLYKRGDEWVCEANPKGQSYKPEEPGKRRIYLQQDRNIITNPKGVDEKEYEKLLFKDHSLTIFKNKRKISVIPTGLHFVSLCKKNASSAISFTNKSRLLYPDPAYLVSKDSSWVSWCEQKGNTIFIFKKQMNLKDSPVETIMVEIPWVDHSSDTTPEVEKWFLSEDETLMVITVTNKTQTQTQTWAWKKNNENWELVLSIPDMVFVATLDQNSFAMQSAKPSPKKNTYTLNIFEFKPALFTEKEIISLNSIEKPVPLTPILLSFTRPEVSLQEREKLCEAQEKILYAFHRHEAVYLSGGGYEDKIQLIEKTAILLDKPYDIFPFHNGTLLENLIGSFVLSNGKLLLNNLPHTDSKGKEHYDLPLLEMMKHGGLFVLDKGLLEEKSKQLLSFFHSILKKRDEQGYGEVLIYHIPGYDSAFSIHPDFHLMILDHQSDIESDANAKGLPIEIAGKINKVFLNTQKTQEDLQNDVAALLPKNQTGLASQIVSLYLTIKQTLPRAPLTPKDLYRAAKFMAKDHSLLSEDLSESRLLSILRMLQMVWGEAFSRRSDAEKIFNHWASQQFQSIKKDQINAWLLSNQNNADRDNEAITAIEILAEADIPVALRVEPGASAHPIQEALQKRHKNVFVVDALEENDEFDVIGGLVPSLEDESLLTYARGVITRYLVEREQKEAQKGKKMEDVWIYIRHYEQWSEDLKFRLNELLEKGSLRVHENGTLKELFKPDHLHFLCELSNKDDYSMKTHSLESFVPLTVKPYKPKDFQRYLQEILPASSFKEEILAYAVKFYEKLPYKTYALSETMLISLFQCVAFMSQEPNAPELSLLICREAFRLLVPAVSEENRNRLITKILDALKLSSQVLENKLFFTTNSYGQMTSLEGVPLPGQPLLDKKHRSLKTEMHYNSSTVSALAVLLRADRLGKAVWLMGESGLAKTTLTAHCADLLGREYFKYQSHRDSSVRDWTYCLSLKNNTLFKETQELYSKLKKGNCVIDIDEANISPHILYVLWPLIAHEEWVVPLFPGEEPFKIGSDILLVFTSNPDSYSGRKKIPLMIKDHVWMCHMRPPLNLEQEGILATFYSHQYAGAKQHNIIHLQTHYPLEKKEDDEIRPMLSETEEDAEQGSEDDNDEGKKVFILKKQSSPRDHFKLTYKLKAHPIVQEIQADSRMAEQEAPLIKNFSQLHTVVESIATKLNTRIVWKEVFDPETPYVREDVFDQLTPDGQSLMSSVDKEALLKDGWHPFPSSSPDMEIETAAFIFDNGERLTWDALEFFKDANDLFYVRARNKRPLADGRLVLEVSSDPDYFGYQDLPQNTEAPCPAQVSPDIEKALQIIQENHPLFLYRNRDLRDLPTFFERVEALYSYIYSFKVERNGIDEVYKENVFLNILASRCGVCRQRTFVFVKLALALGLQAAYVQSLERKHAWVELTHPNTGKKFLLDLGGGGNPDDCDRSNLPADAFQKRHKHPFTGFEDKQTEELYKQLHKKSRYIYKNGKRQKTSQKLAQDIGATKHFSPEDLLCAVPQQGLEPNDEEMHQKGSVLGSSLWQGKRPNDAQKIFERTLQALHAASVHMLDKREKSGVKIDPLAFIQHKDKPFITRKKENGLPEMTAMAMLFDFSRSMASVDLTLKETLSTVFLGLAYLKNVLKEKLLCSVGHFASSPYFDISFEDRLNEGEAWDVCLRMQSFAGQMEGTNIRGTLMATLEKFKKTPDALRAKNKYVILLTDGEDNQIENDSSPETCAAYFSSILEEYKALGVDIFIIGLGAKARYVSFFKNKGQYFVHLSLADAGQITEAMALFIENKTQGFPMPYGDLTERFGFNREQRSA